MRLSWRSPINAAAALQRVIRYKLSRKPEPVTVPPQEYDRRRAVCALCPASDGLQCGDCTCFIAAKAALRTETCPRNKW